jgi:hypothetical protein
MLSWNRVISANSCGAGVNLKCQFRIICYLSVYRFNCIESKVLRVKTCGTWLNILSVNEPMCIYFDSTTYSACSI